jgi:hypothetical protein
VPKPKGPGQRITPDAQMTGYHYDPDGVPVIHITIGRVKPNNEPKPGPIGNTQGIIVPETSPNTSGSTSAPTPEGPPGEAKGWWKSWGSDVTHGVLDVVGLIPIIGEPANLIGAGIYVAEGRYVEAAMDVAAAVPGFGWGATGAKNATKLGGAVLEQAAKKGDDVAEAIVKHGDDAAGAAGKQADDATAAAKKKEDGGNVKGKPRCRLRKYSKGCPGGQTPHHVVPDRAFKMPDQTRIPGGLSHGNGYTVCVDGATPVRKGPKANEHGLIHDVYDPAERLLGAAGTPKGTATLGELEALAVAIVCSVTKCNPVVMAAELRAYHQMNGLSPTMKFRADPSGAMIRGANPLSLGRTPTGLGGI